MIHAPLGIERVRRVQAADDDRSIKVWLDIMPPGATLPDSLGKREAYAVTLNDADRTPMRVRSVAVIETAPAVVLEIAVQPATSGTFTVRVEGMVPGLDAAQASWGTYLANVDPGMAPPVAPPPAAAPSIPNYLYRDYASFKQLMLDVVQRSVPLALELHEADAGIAAVEVLAYAADHLAYHQDAVATEAYLETARRRVSIRRHTRLLGYRLFEGCTPRVWIHICPDEQLTFAAGSRFATQADEHVVSRCFESMQAQTVSAHLCDLRVWDFAGAETVLPAGRTTAVIDAPAAAGPDIRAGDVFVIEQRSDPLTSAPTSALHRQAVRLRRVGAPFPHPSEKGRCLVQVTWFADDALTRSFDLRTDVNGQPVTFVHGNMIIADYGQQFFDPQWYEMDERGIVQLPIPDLVFATSWGPNDTGVSAEMQALRPYQAMPSIVATTYQFGKKQVWTARHDLIGANASDQVFAVEIERNGMVMLRFGDGQSGARPLPRARFQLSYRRGRGSHGMIGPDAISINAIERGIAYRAWNPMASFGGADPQDGDAARREAPERVLGSRPRRCIADDDFVRLACSVRGVRAAAVRRRWTGNGMTVQLYVDGDDTSDILTERVGAVIEGARVIGTSVNVRGPRVVGVIASVRIRVAHGASAGDVARRVAAAVAIELASRSMTLGSTIYASWLVAAAMGTPGVAEADVTAFARFDQRPHGVKSSLSFDATEKPAIVDDRGIATDGRPIVEVVP